jgi:hypothetical protein
LKEDSQITVKIVGTSGGAAVWGFHHYLKYYCFSHVSWDSDQLALPEELPPVNLTVVSADRLVTPPACSVLQSNFFRYVVTLLTYAFAKDVSKSSLCKTLFLTILIADW